MDDWWREIDDAVLGCLLECGESSPEEIGRRLGMSTEAAVSVLAMLAQQGRVRISRAEAVENAASAGRAVMSIGGGAAAGHGLAGRKR
jgi:hypothetical protein